MDHDLGYFDPETRVLEPLENPVGRLTVTHVTGRRVTHLCSRAGPFENGGAGRIRTADTQFRKLLLYPSELQPHKHKSL
jgi:hypothetical protein